MDENLTPRAQATLEAAALLARARGHSYVGVQHLLPALINSGPSVASAALARCDVNIDDLSTAIEWLMPSPRPRDWHEAPTSVGLWRLAQRLSPCLRESNARL